MTYHRMTEHEYWCPRELFHHLIDVLEHVSDVNVKCGDLHSLSLTLTMANYAEITEVKEITRET